MERICKVRSFLIADTIELNQNNTYIINNPKASIITDFIPTNYSLAFLIAFDISNIKSYEIANIEIYNNDRLILEMPNLKIGENIKNTNEEISQLILNGNLNNLKIFDDGKLIFKVILQNELIYETEFRIIENIEKGD